MKLSILKFLLLAGALITLVGSMSQTVSAQSFDPFQEVCREDPNATACLERGRPQDTSSNAIYGPEGILTKAARFIALVVGVASVIMIIVGGYQYVLSTGDATKVGKAKDTIIYAVIGIVIAAAAQAIIVFVLEKL